MIVLIYYLKYYTDIKNITFYTIYIGKVHITEWLIWLTAIIWGVYIN